MSCDGLILMGLVALSVLVRMPAFANAVIDWDETVYLVVGQDLARGHLPYARYWAMKPPLGFVFYATSVALFGNSIIALRAFGAVYIGVAAYLTYAAGRRLHSRTAGGGGAVALIAFATYIGSGKAVMMEHIALLPLAWLAFQVCGGKASAWQLGLAISVCALIRTNLALLLPAAIWFHWQFETLPRKTPFALLNSTLRVTSAAALPVAGVVAIYWLAGHLQILYTVNVTFALMFMETNRLTPERALNLSYLLSWRNVLLAASALYSTWLFWRRGHARDDALGPLLLFAVCVFVSILLTGDKYSHYNIQFLPFLTLPFGHALASLLHRRPYRAWILWFCLIVVGGTALQVNRIADVAGHVWRTHTWPGLDGPFYQAADYLKSHDIEGRFVFCPQNPILTFLTGSLLPTAVVNPNDYRFDSRLKVLYGPDYTHLHLARDIFAKAPKFVIVWTAGRPFPEIAPYLEEDYHIEVETRLYQIYGLRDDRQ